MNAVHQLALAFALVVAVLIFAVISLEFVARQRDKARDRVDRLEEELYAYRQEDARYQYADQQITHLFDEAEQSVWDRVRRRA